MKKSIKAVKWSIFIGATSKLWSKAKSISLEMTSKWDTLVVVTVDQVVLQVLCLETKMDAQS